MARLKPISATIKALLGLLIIGGLAAAIESIGLYRSTMIDPGLTLFLWLVPGIVLTPITLYYFARHFETDSVVMHFVYNVLSFGGWLVFAFLAINFYYAEIVGKYTFPILRKGEFAQTRYSPGEPYIIFIFSGAEKQLVFEMSQKAEVENADSVAMTVKVGSLGYELGDEFSLVQKPQPKFKRIYE